MKTLIIGTLDFLGHIYAVAMILGGAAYGYNPQWGQVRKRMQS